MRGSVAVFGIIQDSGKPICIIHGSHQIKIAVDQHGEHLRQLLIQRPFHGKEFVFPIGIPCDLL